MSLEIHSSYLTQLIDQLHDTQKLSDSELFQLLIHWQEVPLPYLFEKARDVAYKHFGTHIYTRGLIEISNYCKNDCYYCGIRKSNQSATRYRLTQDEILSCCTQGYELGCRTFVLQSGEDVHWSSSVLCNLILNIKQAFPDCAVTLSVGEQDASSYHSYRCAGADRFLLRHEAAHDALYSKLHPPFQTLTSRKACLDTLKALGYQVGIGFMVDAPYQNATYLLEDIRFIRDFKPAMIGIGPFIPHNATPFKDFPAGSVIHTCFLLSLLRLMLPNVLLPATTALGTLSQMGYEQGIQAGANVIMFNLSPPHAKANYTLYNGKSTHQLEVFTHYHTLKTSIETLGYHFVTCRGDFLP